MEALLNKVSDNVEIVTATVVVLAVMIIVHEFGHFAAAKLCGVRVLTFSVGFGKRLFGFTKGETDYRVSIIPFGGYVRMAGENPFEARSGDPGEFMSHPRWQRIIIAFAGPIANIVLAVGLLAGLYMVRFEYFPVLEKAAVVGLVDPASPAAKAGIQPGDRILRIENKINPLWKDIFDSQVEAKLSPKHPLSISVQRGTQVLQLQVLAEDRPDAPVYLGIDPDERTVISRLEPSLPAYKAGLRLDDEITSLNEQPVSSLTGIIAYLQGNGAKPVTVHLMRKGQALSFTATPYFDKDANKYRLGFNTTYHSEVKRLGLGDALRESVNRNVQFSFMIVKTFQKLLSREVSIRQMTGPLGIMQETGKVLKQEDWKSDLLGLMALISINLGIFNLVPFPILDGGLIAITAFEGLIRRDIDQRVKERMYQTAFVFLILFAAVVMYNDVAKMEIFSKYLP